ncbi:hypothetical protein IB277_31170 [Ensifer sp. ENS07]|uniref:hypothetical protein n=1 Tax=Ensifer sp. ENS07 TaxID=2769274 RepID=UPI001782B104|nr:hypothetical protein [Ensifer sp. ENS07]MBD9640761.1 hypothetical protein [Ensifer sp. ENS07]
MNRRTVLKGGIVLAVTSHTAVSTAEVGTEEPLVAAIRAYRAGLIAFGELPDSDFGKVETYEPWQEILDNWNEPARTREGAIEALRAALGDDDGLYGCEGADRMVKAALGYLEALS